MIKVWFPTYPDEKLFSVYGPIRSVETHPGPNPCLFSLSDSYSGFGILPFCSTIDLFAIGLGGCAIAWDFATAHALHLFSGTHLSFSLIFIGIFPKFICFCCMATHNFL